MKSLLAYVAALAACADPPARDAKLVEIDQLTAIVDADVGVPQDPLGTPSIGTGVSVYIDYPGSACYSLATTTATVDGSEPDAFLAGGMDADAACEKPAIYLDAPPTPRDVSTITLADDTATYSLTVARLFVNPTITLPTTLSVGPQVARIDDPRAIAAATVWWRSADGTQGWMKPVDASTHGELRFTIPTATSGRGTLGITITIRDNAVSCVGFASCKAIVRGGGAFDVTVQ